MPVCSFLSLFFISSLFLFCLFVCFCVFFGGVLLLLLEEFGYGLGSFLLLGAFCFLVFLCLFVFPEMKHQRMSKAETG